MTDLVDQTLRHWRRAPFAYGSEDCMLSIGRYIAAAGGRDITGRFVGRYSTQDGALAAMAAAGGFASLVEEAGASRVSDAPRRGDVLGLIYDSDDLIGALCTGDGAAVRLERGVAEVSLRLVQIGGVWRVGR